MTVRPRGPEVLAGYSTRVVDASSFETPEIVPEPWPPPDEGSPPTPEPVPEPYPPPDEATPPSPTTVPEPDR